MESWYCISPSFEAVLGFSVTERFLSESGAD